MNVLESECSSGCESGWTIYLDQSYSRTNASHSHRVDGEKCKGEKCEDEEEEDLSMVSDASSGPPHFHEGENYSHANGGVFCSPTPMTKSSGKRKKNRGNRHLLDQQIAFLDDTASSPAFNNSSQNNYAFTNKRTSTESVLEFTQVVPAPYQESGSTFKGNYGGYMQPSHSRNQFENNQWLTRRGWE